MQAQPSEQTLIVERFPTWAAVYLAHYSIGGQLYTAADAAGIERTTVWYLRQLSPRFAQLEVEAKARSLDLARQELFTRAVVGWSEPVFFGGECVGHVTKKSDSLLLAYTKAHDPAYRDKVDLSHTSPKDAPVRIESQVEIVDALAPYRDATRMLLESIAAERALSGPQTPTLEFKPHQVSEVVSTSISGSSRPCPRCDGPGVNPYCPVCHGTGALPDG